MAQLEICTLGGVRLLLDGKAFDGLSTRKVEALAKVYMLQADLERSQAVLERAGGANVPLGTTSERYCAARRAELALLQGKPRQALSILDALLDSIPGLRPDRVISSLWCLQADALMALANYEEAEAVLLAALENAGECDEHFQLWRIEAALGRLYQQTERSEEAQRHRMRARNRVEKLAASIGEEAVRVRFLKEASRLIREES